MDGQRQASAAVLSVIAIAVLGACGSQQAAQDFSKDSVQFTSAQAQRFEEAYRNTDSQAVKRAVVDEKISNAEYDEIQQRYISCLADKGHTATFHPDGSNEIKSPPEVADNAQEDIDRCDSEIQYHAIDYLYRFGGKDTDPDASLTNLVDCLKRHHLADSSLTPEEYQRIITDPAQDSDTFGTYFDETRADYDAGKSAEYWACQANPDS